MNDRIEYFDALKGVAIIGVIAIHVTGSSYGYEDTSLTFNLTVVWRQLINFSVPLFLTISGYFLASKKISRLKNYGAFIKKQIPRILIPYFLWGLLYIGFDLLKGEAINSTIYSFVTFQISTPFYFIFLILQFYLLLPVFKKIAQYKSGIFMSGLLSLICCFVIFYTRYYSNISIPIIFYAGLFPTWMVFYVLGMYLKIHKVNISYKVLSIFLIGSFLLSLIETYTTFSHFNDIYSSVTAVKFSSFLYSISLILMLFKLKDRFGSFPSIIVYLGQISYGVYLTHMLILITIGYTFNQMFHLRVNAILEQFLLILFTVILGILGSFLFRKFNKQLSIKYLGF